MLPCTGGLGVSRLTCNPIFHRFDAIELRKLTVAGEL